MKKLNIYLSFLIIFQIFVLDLSAKKECELKNEPMHWALEYCMYKNSTDDLENEKVQECFFKQRYESYTPCVIKKRYKEKICKFLNTQSLQECMSKKMDLYVDKIDDNKTFIIENNKSLQCLRSDCRYAQLSKRIQKDEKIAFRAVQKTRGFDLHQDLDKSFKHNKRIALMAVKYHVTALDFFDEDIRDDEEVAHKSIYSNFYSLKYASYRFRSDKNLLKKILKEDGNVLAYASKDLREDPELLELAKDKKWLKYTQDSGEFKRKIKPEAWRQYSIENALDELYGIKRQMLISDNLHVDFTGGSVIINSKIKAKSISILQDLDGRASLVSLIYMNNNKYTKLRIPVRTISCAFPESVITVVLEDMDSNLYMAKDSYHYDSNCEGDTYSLYNGTIKKYDQNIKQEEFKVKAKIKLRLKRVIIHLDHEQISYDEAIKQNKSVDFISHVKVVLNGKTIFDYYPSQYNSTRFLTFKSEDIKKGEELSLFIENINGQKVVKNIIVR